MPAAEVEDLLGACDKCNDLLAETLSFTRWGERSVYQSTAPDLVVNGLTYASQCEKWGNALSELRSFLLERESDTFARRRTVISNLARHVGRFCMWLPFSDLTPGSP